MCYLILEQVKHAYLRELFYGQSFMPKMVPLVGLGSAVIRQMIYMFNSSKMESIFTSQFTRLLRKCFLNKIR